MDAIKLYLKGMTYKNFGIIIFSMFLMQFSKNYYDLWLKDYLIYSENPKVVYHFKISIYSF